MAIYDDLLAEVKPGGKLDKLEQISADVIGKLKQSQPKLPEDFLSFLSEIGSGEIGQSAYIIYNGFLEPDEIYDEETAEDLESILIFGDDMQGYCSGFDTSNNWVVVEIDPTDMSYEQTHATFSDFIRNKLQDI